MNAIVQSSKNWYNKPQYKEIPVKMNTIQKTELKIYPASKLHGTLPDTWPTRL